MKKRNTKIIRKFLMHPAGSVLVETGKTKVICTATVETGVPSFIKDAEPKQGWLTAEYSMLPAAPNERFRRERKGIKGRTAEIQRLIGRSLRAIVDLTKFPGYQITIDCDVIQADGGTRTASITGACVALYDALSEMKKAGQIESTPFKEWVAAISVGIVKGKPVVDLCYEEDSEADVDMNVVMTESGKFIEIQGTAEGEPFDEKELAIMLKDAKSGIMELIKYQKEVIRNK